MQNILCNHQLLKTEQAVSVVVSSYQYYLKIYEEITQPAYEKTGKERSKEPDYKNFLDEHEDNLNKEFDTKHNFQTSIRGIKVRGSFPNQQEAELRCKMLRQNDPSHDVYVGPVGIWVPFHPEASKTGRVEYMEETLNELMSEKKKNEEKAKDEFENRVKESKQKAIEDNKKKAAETGAKLTQTINAEGNLISVANMNTQEESMGKNATLEDVKKELFEGDNIVIDKNTDHGLSNLESEETQESEEYVNITNA